VLVKGGWRWK